MVCSYGNGNAGNAWVSLEIRKENSAFQEHRVVLRTKTRSPEPQTVLTQPLLIRKGHFSHFPHADLQWQGRRCFSNLAKSFQPHSREHQRNSCCTQVPKRALFEIQEIFRVQDRKGLVWIPSPAPFALLALPVELIRVLSAPWDASFQAWLPGCG